MRTMCFFQGRSQSSLLFPAPPFCVYPLPLYSLQLFVNEGPLSHIPATGGSFTLTAVGWLSMCVPLGDVLALMSEGLLCYLNGRKVLWVSLSFVWLMPWY